MVEDVPLIRMATMDMIEQIGFRAAEAGDGAEALALLQKDPEIAILLTDLGLPGMNGRQLVEEARRAQARPESDHRLGLFQRRQWPWPRCWPSHQAV